MGIHAIIYMIIHHLNLDFLELIKYLPVSLCYIVSMIIGYKGLKYMELSLSSPIQNTSGVITSMLLIIFFHEKLDYIAYLAFILVFIGLLIIFKEEKREERKVKLKKISLLVIFFPIFYCLIDGLGTFLDGIYLDKLELISEDNALICYEFTFLIYAIITLIILKIKGVKVKLFREKNKIIAALLETLGQFFYVFAMAHNSTIGATIVGSYCLLSLVLSHIFLKEKLNKRKYCGLFIAIIGIIILAILDI
jgi:drug/metabolite transporter (DMT)-like permease